MQQIITAIEADMKLNGLLDGCQRQRAISFPGRLTLSTAEKMLVINRTCHGSSQSAASYIAVFKEAADTERHAELCAKLQNIADKLTTTPVQSPDTESCVPQETPSTSSAYTTAADPTLGTFSRNSTELRMILTSCGHRDWFDEVGEVDLLNSICSYLIHTKRYEMLEVVLKNSIYPRGVSVSAQLATNGDLDALKWMSANPTISSGMWASNLVIERATAHGHLHILIWLKRTSLVHLHIIGDWNSAVSGDHLNIIQWYFVAFPDTAKALAPKIYKFAEDKVALNIVDWMNTVGLSPVD